MVALLSRPHYRTPVKSVVKSNPFMWNWPLKTLGKFSVTAMLREQLALAKARVAQLEIENAELKAKAAVLEAELKLIREQHDQTKQQFKRLQKEHEEEIRTWRTVEFRRGRRTFGVWAAFCPSCHMPVNLKSFTTECSAKCGWVSEMSQFEIQKFLHFLETGEKGDS